MTATPPPQDRADARVAWAFTVAATVPSLGYVLALSLARDALATRIAGGVVSVGLVAGLALAAFIVVLAVAYTVVANRREAG